MIKLLLKIFLSEILLTILPVVIFQDYFEINLRGEHPVLNAIDTVVTFIFCQGFLCLVCLLILGVVYAIWIF